MCLLAFPPVRLRAGRQAHRQEGRQVQGFAHLRICLYGNRQACRPFCLQSKGHFSISVSFWSLVAASGSKWWGVASFLSRFQGLKRPTFAPKRQGNAPGAYRSPRLRPSFGQPEGIGRPIPLWDCYNRHIPNRRTKQEQSQARLNYVLQGGGRVTLNPSATDFCVL